MPVQKSRISHKKQSIKTPAYCAKKSIYRNYEKLRVFINSNDIQYRMPKQCPK
jgi:hypothetical protein